MTFDGTDGNEERMVSGFSLTDVKDVFVIHHNAWGYSTFIMMLIASFGNVLTHLDALFVDPVYRIGIRVSISKWTKITIERAQAQSPTQLSAAAPR